MPNRPIGPAELQRNAHADGNHEQRQSDLLLPIHSIGSDFCKRSKRFRHLLLSDARRGNLALSVVGCATYVVAARDVPTETFLLRATPLAAGRRNQSRIGAAMNTEL